MGEGTVSEGHVAAVDALQLGGPDPLDNLFDNELPWCSFWDDENGASLKTDHVNEARKVELDWFRDHGVYDRRKISECLQHAGAKPIRLLWVDTNKGDDAKENYRSGLVVREKRYRRWSRASCNVFVLCDASSRKNQDVGKPDGDVVAKQT